MRKTYKIKIAGKEISVVQDSDGKFIIPDFVKELKSNGSALKPANEPICLARKPLSEKTIAANVLKWGTGGMNIDGCRIKTEIPQKKWESPRGGIWTTDSKSESTLIDNQKGRFPANVILDGSEEVVSRFPYSTSGEMDSISQGKNYGIYGKYNGMHVKNKASSGSASRFFYCAKASKSERNKGLEGFEKKIGGMRSETSGQHITRRDGGDPKPVANNHPTVKPVSLMRYLCRLITPPKGIVLDPFMGSGSTGIGAKLEGFSFIGIEKEEEYCKIAEARINAWKEEKKEINNKITELTLF